MSRAKAAVLRRRSDRRKSSVEPPLSERLDRQLMPFQELGGLGAGEDPGGGADRADAACADGAGELQTVQLGKAFEQADDVTGIEGVAAAGAVDEIRPDRRPA